MPRLLTFVFTLNLLFLALRLPAYPESPWIAADALLLAGLFVLLPPGRWRLAAAAPLGILYGALVLTAAGEALIKESLGRSLNIYLDIGLLKSVYSLFTTNLDPVPAFFAMATAAGLLLGLAALVTYLFCQLEPKKRPSRLPGAALLVAGILALVPGLPGELTAAGILGKQLQLAAATRISTAEFEARVSARPSAHWLGSPRPLPRLEGTDVILGFIESYGLSTLTDPRYEPVIGPRLEAMEQALSSAGLHLVSGRLRSPVQGGQSWLAHATVLSGQWVDSQLDYEVLLASGYPTLIDDFRATGHETIAVMPAITRDWPEGRQFGYDRIHDARSMDYQGPSLNWVTMPDQYTWSFFQQRIRETVFRPLFAEVALISSHAPWVPIIDVLPDWDAIGRGEVFNRWKGSGEAPDSLWRDHDRVREHYARAVDYALEVVTGYAVRYIGDDSLLVIVGDHQPAPLITGPDASRDVIVHVISANLDLLEAFTRASEGSAPTAVVLPTFQKGAFPQLEGTAAGMDDFRPFLQRAYSKDQPR